MFVDHFSFFSLRATALLPYYLNSISPVPLYMLHVRAVSIFSSLHFSSAFCASIPFILVNLVRFLRTFISYL